MSFFQKLKRLTVSSASSVGSTASSAVSASGGGSAAGAGGAAEEDEDAAATVLNPFTEAQVLQSHRDAVRLLLQIDPLRLVSGADDGRLCVWDVPSARLLRSLVGHSGRVNCAAMLNGLLLSAASDHTVRMWDPNSGECLMVSLAQRSAPFFSCYITVPLAHHIPTSFASTWSFAPSLG